MGVGREGLGSSESGDGDEELGFAEWARGRVPTGLDAEKVVAIALGFLAEAAAAELEAEVAE